MAGAGENWHCQLCGRNLTDPVRIYAEVATKHREDAARVSSDIIEHDRQKLFVGKNALPPLYAGQIVSTASRPGGFEVIEEPQVRRFVDRHFRSFKSHQGRRPCSCYRIAQRIEDTKIWQQRRNFSNCSLVQRGVGWRDLALLSPLMIIGKQTDPPLNPVAAAAIPEMDFLTCRKPYIGMFG
jgi:hypothetical protein